jgi:hypothetical protein
MSIEHPSFGKPDDRRIIIFDTTSLVICGLVRSGEASEA